MVVDEAWFRVGRRGTEGDAPWHLGGTTALGGANFEEMSGQYICR